MTDLNRTGPYQPQPAGEISVERPQRIGRYQVDELLGEGGFGTVYRALDEQLQRLVAIKVPHRRLILRPEDAAAYLAEARTVANLDHANIVPVYDVGSTSDCPCFVVSKYVEGCSLARKMRDVRPSLVETVELVGTVAGTLHYAHQNGVVHRDIKPGNILLDAGGRPYVADFGVALREENVGHGPRYIGTPAYMSPEQARGEGHRVDGRSDIFSLGVVLYELLTGRRPFHAEDREQLLEQIASHDPRPPRQWDDTVPKGLERICLKALAKRASDRYTTARDLADDLRHFLEQSPEEEKLAQRSSVPAVAVALPVAASTPTPGPAPTSGPGPVKIVPKGLRPFDAHDADFFLDLLPGPRDRDGLPDGIRFWKTRIEETDPDGTFAVGLLYGPSGCGKSSLVKAGLLPRLSHDVIAVHVEATAQDTEARLLQALRKRCPALSAASGLKETLAALRRGLGVLPGKKLLIVLDQFEQWLHARASEDRAELVQALRHCDGGRVQCIVMVRDDFWLAVSRFMKVLEIRLLEGQNSALVDLFDLDHARKVLAAFGRAFGKLPEKPQEITKEQQEFLNQAVTGLGQENKVVCVRLALFAEMLKGRPWTPAALKQVGGAEGVGAAFLDETFCAATAPPEHRFHEKAARAVLRALLPEPVADIKGRMRSYAELVQASGYADRPKDFEELMRILDSEVRLLTPTDAEGGEQDADAPSADQAGQKRYQLTHDYLVHSLRQWLTRKQRETRRGRAELLLSDRAAIWMARRENRQLPSLPQWLQIRWLTRKNDWTAPQAAMMRRAGRLHAARAAALAAVLAGLCLAGLFIWGQVREQRRQDQAVALVQRLRVADTAQAPGIIEELKEYRSLARPQLRQALAEAAADSKERLHLSLALLADDPTQADYLSDRLLRAGPAELPVIRDALRGDDALRRRMWDLLREPQADPDRQLRAACALAGWELEAGDAEHWRAAAPLLAGRLVAAVQQDPPAFPMWTGMIRSMREPLTQPLTDIFHNADRPEEARTAAAILGDYVGDQPNVLADLLADADPKQYAILFPRLLAHREAAITRLTEELARTADPVWKDAPLDPVWTAPGSALKRQVEAAGGMTAEHFAICQALPLREFDAVASELRSCGYRPVRLRPYAAGDAVQAAVLWTRDGRPWQAAAGMTSDEVRRQDAERRQQGFQPVDVAGYMDGGEARYAALWVKGGEADEARLYVGVRASRLKEDGYGPMRAAELKPATLQILASPGAEDLFSMVWRKSGPSSEAFFSIDNEDYAADCVSAGLPTDVSLYDVRESIVNTRAEVLAWFSGSPWSGLYFRSLQLSQPHPGPYSGCFQHTVASDHALALGLAPADQLRRCWELAGQDFRPAALSAAAAWPAEQLTTASVWIRPAVPDDAKERLAKRQANGAAALLMLGQGDRVWSLLQLRPDPRLRSHLIHRLSPLGADPQVLVRRLSEEPDISAKRALLLCLGEFGPHQLPQTQREALIPSLLKLYSDDPDPGLHGAAEWLLRQWEKDEMMRQIDQGLATGKVEGQRRWYVNGEGQTMVLVLDPPEFMMGSPRSEAGRRGGPDDPQEMQHLRQIGRSFAIAAKEVTVEQFLKFPGVHPFSKLNSSTPQHPMNGVTWYDAAAYCNWLSEKEGIPPDQWCYVPTRPGTFEQGLRMRPNYLSLTGYRLPTEAEWEFACRAGTVTSYYHGETEELLVNYAWYTKNAQNRGLLPPGTLKPNDLGLFDMLGNALEWCQGVKYQYPHTAGGPAPDAEDVSEETAGVRNGLWRAMRGGAYNVNAWDLRSADRGGSMPTGRGFDVGLRVARTVR